MGGNHAKWGKRSVVERGAASLTAKDLSRSIKGFRQANKQFPGCRHRRARMFRSVEGHTDNPPEAVPAEFCYAPFCGFGGHS
jgi:hypothetical protein